MKKILFLLFLLPVMLAICYESQGQISFTGTVTSPLDSLTNTGSDTLHCTLTHGYNALAIQPLITKVSGTVAGTSYLYYSVNGSNWILDDSLTLTNVTTNTTFWNKTVTFRYCRIITGRATTLKAKYSATLQTT